MELKERGTQMQRIFLCFVRISRPLLIDIVTKLVLAAGLVWSRIRCES